MLAVNIPGYDKLQIEHLLLDFNGTIAFDGRVIDGVREALSVLAKDVEIHVVTADTFGDVSQQLEGIPVKLTILPEAEQDQGKLGYLSTLGAEITVAIGNGRNDRLMLKQAAIGIALIQEEGISVEALTSADIACKSIRYALGLLLHPKRLIATLRA
ncbi:MAG: ATPase P [Desulfuromonadales bacterium]|jgi:soluble P-type ATPase|nr:ATPase P [Desulfuromonadales bacterium]